MIFFILIFIISIILIYLPILLPIVQSVIHNSKLSFKWYNMLFHDYDLWHSLYNSFFIGITSSTLGVMISVLNIYSSLYYIALLPLIIPEIIIGIILLIMYCKIFSGTTLLIIGHTTLAVAYTSLSIRSVYNKRDLSIEEAASDLGANPNNIFKIIILPLLMPTIIEAWAIAFSISLDDVMLASILSGQDICTFPMELYSRLKSGNVNYDISALFTVMLILFTITFFTIQKIRNITNKKS